MDVKALVARLQEYGLDDGEATVYYHLCRSGGLRASEAATAAKRKRPDTYRILDALVRKGFAEKTLERPTRFLPIDIEEALQRLVQVRRRQADALSESATELAKEWPKPHGGDDVASQRFTVYQGKQQVEGLMARMFASATEEVAIVVAPGGLARLGLEPFLRQLQTKPDIDVRLLTKPEGGRHEHLDGAVDVRLAELPSYHQMVIIDSGQIALFVSSGRKLSTKGEEQTVLWLNSTDFVLAQKALFDAVWATGLGHAEHEQAAAEGRLPKEMRLLRGRWQRYDRLRRMMDGAKRAIMLRAPTVEVSRWKQAGITASLRRRAKDVEICVWTDAALDIPGIKVIADEKPIVFEALIDDRQCLMVYGAAEAGGAVAYEDEWSIWSTHPDQVELLRRRMARLRAGRATRLVETGPE